MKKDIELGLRENSLQFTLLVIVNAFVGAMIGLERTLLPEIAEKDFGMVAKTAILSFIVVFGLSKAVTNYFAGRFSDQYGRKIVLIIFFKSSDIDIGSKIPALTVPTFPLGALRRSDPGIAKSNLGICPTASLKLNVFKLKVSMRK